MKTKITGLYKRYLAGVVWKQVGAFFTATEGFFIYVLKLTRMPDQQVTLFAAIMAGLLVFCLLLIPKKGIALALNLVHDAEKEVAAGTATLAIVAPAGSASAAAAKVAEEALPCLDDVLTKAEEASIGTADDAPVGASPASFLETQQKSSDEQLPFPAVVTELLKPASAPTAPEPAVIAAPASTQAAPASALTLIETLIKNPPTAADFFGKPASDSTATK